MRVIFGIGICVLMILPCHAAKVKIPSNHLGFVGMENELRIRFENECDNVNLEVTSEDGNIATCEKQGNKYIVTGVSAGKTHIKARLKKTEETCVEKLIPTYIGIMEVQSMQWQSSDTQKSNQFDLVDENGQPLIPEDTPEWDIQNGSRADTVYIKGSQVQADVKFRFSPVIPEMVGKEFYVRMYTSSDVDLTLNGEGKRNFKFTMTEDGIFNRVFRSREKNTDSSLSRKEYKFKWEGATEQVVTQNIYTVYDTPNDFYNNHTDSTKPCVKHLAFVLGPGSLGQYKGWVTGGKTLRAADIPQKALDGARFVSRENENSQGECDPREVWGIIDGTSGVNCEMGALLMFECLQVLGVPESGKLKICSVVSNEIKRNKWLGETVPGGLRLLRAFSGRRNPGVWYNHGTCGVNTDDQGWVFYDVTFLGIRGKGGWDDPFNWMNGENLWYQPYKGDSKTAPIMVRMLDQFGIWEPLGLPPYHYGATKKPFSRKQVKIVSLVKRSSGMYRVTYRTEGYSWENVRIQIGLYKKEENGQWSAAFPAPGYFMEKPVAGEWDNLETLDFMPAASGFHAVNIRAVDARDYTRTTWADPEFIEEVSE